MRLSDLFESDDSMSFMDSIRNAVIDMLTPLVANRQPFVTFQEIVDELKPLRLGLDIDRMTLMNVLDPNNIPCIKRIDGDKIYLSLTIPDEHKASASEEQKDQDHMAAAATSQAKKSMEGGGKTAPLINLKP